MPIKINTAKFVIWYQVFYNIVCFHNLCLFMHLIKCLICVYDLTREVTSLQWELRPQREDLIMQSPYIDHNRLLVHHTGSVYPCTTRDTLISSSKCPSSYLECWCPLKGLPYSDGLTAILRRSECHYYGDKKLACRIRLVTVTDGWTVREINELSDEWEAPSSQLRKSGRHRPFITRTATEKSGKFKTEVMNYWGIWHVIANSSKFRVWVNKILLFRYLVIV